MKNSFFRWATLGCAVSLTAIYTSPATNRPLIFPAPQELEVLKDRFELSAGSIIAVPVKASQFDLALARMLREDLADRWGISIPIEHIAALRPGKTIILVGAMSNPLVSAYVTSQHVEAVPDRPSGYILQVNSSVVLVAGKDDDGAFYGLQSLRQLVSNSLTLPGLRVRDWPYKPFRGIRLFLPGRNNIPFFKRFVRDFVALYKFNKLMIEVNASMRFERHPELNSGWLEFSRDVNYTRRNYPAGPPHEVEQNSSHQDAGDGGLIEKEEVRELVAWARKYHLEVIPEVPSFSHSFYLLSAHPELSEVPNERWPDTYCPSHPGTYKLLFDVLDEYIEVMKPQMVHIGHDEAYAPLGMCPRCKGKDTRELYAQDVAKIHDFLAKHGVGVAMWGDMLLEKVRGRGPQNHTAPDGFKYQISGALTPELAQKLPHDILLFNWFWDGRNGRANEDQLEQFGFKQIYGNLEPNIVDFAQRSARESMLGGAASSWAETSEFIFGKDLMLSFLGTQSLLWSNRNLGSNLAAVIQSMMPEIRRRLRGESPPSELGDPVTPLDISSRFNMPAHEPVFNIDLSDMNREGNATKVAIIVGTEGAERNPLPRAVDGIPVGLDATSLLFLHAAAKPATNKLGDRMIWDNRDTADLLGWYEVVYEDGYVTTIPIRYGVQLLEWNWRPGQPFDRYCYAADAVYTERAGGHPASFFVYEWTNPRLGKLIKEVRLHGTTGFRGAVAGYENGTGPVIPNNAIILKGLSAVKVRTDADSQRLRRIPPDARGR